MESIWKSFIDPQEPNDAHPSPANLEFDVVIIGAGISGILTGYFLNQSGLRIALLESHTACSGVTLNTTAKITLAPRLMYHKLLHDYGEVEANQYVTACQTALSTYATLISSHNIDCDFETLPMIIYSNEQEKTLVLEYEAASNLGVDCKIIDSIELPIPITNALRFEDQAQFNPIKFLNHIKKDLPIYENTHVTDIRKHVIHTTNGVLRAKNIIVTTHYPMIKYPGLYFMKMHQERSYALALENTQKLSAMYADTNQNGLAFRSYQNYLILSGSSHRTGENPNGGQYGSLRAAAKNMYPDSIERYHWSTQDCITLDHLPFIGKYAKTTQNIYTATGFNKWGMNYAMLSAMILSDRVLHKEQKISRTSSYAGVFTPQRFYYGHSFPILIDEMKHAFHNRIVRKHQASNQTLNQLEPGQNIIVDSTNGKLGAYRDFEGKLHLVSAVCPHLHCILVFNPEELTWDCPCHGSRIDLDGNVIKNPAIKEN